MAGWTRRQVTLLWLLAAASLAAVHAVTNDPESFGTSNEHHGLRVKRPRLRPGSLNQVRQRMAAIPQANVQTVGPVVSGSVGNVGPADGDVSFLSAQAQQQTQVHLNQAQQEIGDNAPHKPPELPPNAGTKDVPSRVTQAVAEGPAKTSPLFGRAQIPYTKENWDKFMGGHEGQHEPDRVSFYNPVAYDDDYWELFLHDTFDSPHSPAWSGPMCSECGSVRMLGGPILTQDGKGHEQKVTATIVGDLPLHSVVRIVASVSFLDDWEKEIAYMKVDKEVVWSASCENCGKSGNNYCGNKGFADSISRSLDVVVDHDGHDIAVTFGTTLAGKRTNVASFGVSNFRIFTALDEEGPQVYQRQNLDGRPIIKANERADAITIGEAGGDPSGKSAPQFSKLFTFGDQLSLQHAYGSLTEYSCQESDVIRSCS